MNVKISAKLNSDIYPITLGGVECLQNAILRRPPVNRRLFQGSDALALASLVDLISSSE